MNRAGLTRPGVGRGSAIPSRAIARALPLALLLLLATRIPAGAQRVDEPDREVPGSWRELARDPSVGANLRSWLADSLQPGEAERLFDRVLDLSAPAAAQLLPARFYADPSFHLRRTWDAGLDSLVKALSDRPTGGPAGLVQVARAVERIRRATRPRSSEPRSLPAPFEIAPGAPSERFSLALDFAPARSILDVLEGESDPVSIEALLDDPVFRALRSHRSQSFYPMPLTREILAENLRIAASDRPVDALYRYAFPTGLLHYSDVRDRRGFYRALVDTLSGHSAEIASSVSARLGPYVPDGRAVHRTVHVLFADGADGWASGGVAAVDLEYFGDDYERLIRMLAHESYHAVQTASREASGAVLASTADSTFVEILEALFREGTATRVAPPRPVAGDEYARLVGRGSDLLRAAHDALYGAVPPDVPRAERLASEGLRSSGPLYWLGAEMARRIEARFGRAALAETLRGGGIPFATRYIEAVGTRALDPLIDPDVGRTIHRLSEARSRSVGGPAPHGGS